MSEPDVNELMMLAIKASLEAGKKILNIYDQTFSVGYKSDGSPLTDADNASHDIIEKMLARTNIPMLSEEGIDIPFETRSNWTYYWLVDPLDGTKEFIKRNGEFSVNIALMKNKSPVAGVIFQPVSDFIYAGIIGSGCYKIKKNEKEIFNNSNKIPEVRRTENVIRVVGSRTHKSAETESYINDLKLQGKQVEIRSRGSALKFCLLAEGEADVYPRFAPTMEWDTAAGHALLKSSGKNIYVYPGGEEMHYNKPQLTNEWFIAR